MKLSIIIPVYNTKIYLEKCVSAFPKQFALEILMIDDGSTDGSFDVCDRLAAENHQIRVIHQKNKGVSAARNRGIEEAKGEWVTFVDSDDWVREDFVERLLPMTEGVDWVLSGDEYFRDNKTTRKMILRDELWTLDDLISDKVNYLDMLTSPHGKLFKKEIIDRFRIRFDEKLSWGEDRDFNIEYLNHVQNICSSSYVGYCYNEGVAGSLSKCQHEGAFEGDIRYWNKMHKLLGEHQDDYQANRLFYFMVDNMAGFGKKQGWKQACSEIRKLKPIIDSEYLKRNLGKVEAPMWQKLIAKVCL